MRRVAAFHKLLGIIMVLPLAFMALTGTAMLLTRTVHGLVSPMPIRMPSETATHTLDEQMAAARAAGGAGAKITAYVSPSDARSLAAFTIARADAEPITMLVDPSTLATGRYDDRDTAFYEWMHHIHETLLAGDSGKSIVGIFGVGMLLLVMAGAPAWFKPKAWRREPFTFKRGWLRVHGAVGAWALAIVVLLPLTGAIMSFPVLGAQLRAVGAAPVAPGCRVRAGAKTQAGSLDEAVAAATAAAPGQRVTSVRMGRGPMRVSLLPDGAPIGGPLTFVTIGPGGSVTCVSDPRTAGIGPFVNAWIRPLHAGKGLTYAWTLVTLAGGLAVLVFTVTGTAMRFRRAPRRA